MYNQNIIDVLIDSLYRFGNSNLSGSQCIISHSKLRILVLIVSLFTIWDSLFCISALSVHRHINFRSHTPSHGDTPRLCKRSAYTCSAYRTPYSMIRMKWYYRSNNVKVYFIKFVFQNWNAVLMIRPKGFKQILEK